MSVRSGHQQMNSPLDSRRTKSSCTSSNRRGGVRILPRCARPGVQLLWEFVLHNIKSPGSLGDTVLAPLLASGRVSWSSPPPARPRVIFWPSCPSSSTNRCLPFFSPLSPENTDPHLARARAVIYCDCVSLCRSTSHRCPQKHVSWRSAAGTSSSAAPRLGRGGWCA